jgi:subtilisin-like proprotein convertase family protein
MINNYFSKSFLTLSFFFIFVGFGFSQTQKQAKEITKKYNLEKLKEYEDSFKKAFYAEQNHAIRLAKQNGWPISYDDDDGTFYQLWKVLNGKPIYIQSDNALAAISTRTDYLHNGGGLGLDLEGQGMTAYIWEVGGIGRVTHQEYDGAGGTDRLTIADGTTTLSSHAAHVTGTIIASGVQANAKGMAPQAKAIGYDNNNDTSEAAAAAANGMLLSNHSYGVPTSSLTGADSWVLGAYLQSSKNWDDVMYNAPYYLQVISAGNDGNDDASNSDPLGGNAAYDKLSFFKTAKNNLIIAAADDAIINGDGSLGSVARASFSSEGPTDDLRIKPDLMGNGVNLRSTFQNFDFAYGILSGTSMASPNVCGSLLLLQQHYSNLNGSFMKAATLKGLALHTADDTEAVGPDAHTGWGLLNTKLAAETITNNGLQTWVSEEVLVNGGTFKLDVQSDGSNPLLASISWTDQGGQINNTGIFNDGTPVLVNDLDIRVTQTTSTFMPWKLTGVDANTQDDNIVDPYERVDIAGASGMYTITVTHKGTLVGGSQNFSLIVTGLSSNFTLNTQSAEQTICSSNDATYSFNYQQTGGATTTFATSGVPPGASVTITPNSLNADGTFDVVFSNLTNVASNTYTINVIGNDGAETETRILTLRILHSDFSANPQSLSTPANGDVGTPTAVTLTWPENLNAESYFVEVSTSPSFSSIAFSGTKTNLNFSLSGLTSETVYYWRVRPDNNCSNGIFSEVFSFQVGSISCGTNVFTATDFTDGNILTTAGDLASAPVTVSTSGLNVEMIEASFAITHTYVNDLKISLEGPPSIGSPQVLLFESSCVTDTGGDTANPGDGNDFNVTFADSGATLFCDDVAVPSIVGTYSPVESLSAYTGLAADGVWTLRIEDPFNLDGGDLTAFSVNVCAINNISSIPNFNNNGFTPALNSTYTFLSSDIEATSAAETATQQVFTVIVLPTVGVLEKNGAPMSVGDTYTQDDVNTGKITYTNTETVTYSDQFKVDIQNAANGWLPNQVVTLNGTLSTNEFELGNLSVWPNPARESINIKLNNISTSADVVISLFDIQGRTIKSASYNSDSNSFFNTIEVNNIENGIYLLEIKQGNKKTTKKIIVNY